MGDANVWFAHPRMDPKEEYSSKEVVHAFLAFDLTPWTSQLQQQWGCKKEESKYDTCGDMWRNKWHR